MTQLNIGMIGAGFIGQIAHLMNFTEVSKCRVLGLAEYRPKLREKVATRFGIERAYSTHTELLNDSDIDAVVVVTPRAFTAPVVLDCLNAGKAVFSEKPMAGNLNQAEKLIEAARIKDTPYTVGYMKRYDPGVQIAKDYIDRADQLGLGEVTFARTHCFMGESYCNADGHIVTDEKAEYGDDQGWPIAPEWLPSEWQQPFASYLNTYSHNTNLIRYFFDETPEVEYSNLTTFKGQVASVRFKNFLTTIETGRASNRNWDEITEIFFTDGSIRVATPPALLKNVPAQVEIYRAGKTQEIIKPQNPWQWSFRNQAEAFVNDVLEGTKSLSHAEDAIEDVKLVEKMWQVSLQTKTKSD